MATKTGQKRIAIILSILMSLTLLVTLSAAPVFASSYTPEGAGKEDPDTKLKLYEEAKEEAEKVLGESPDYSSAYEAGTGVHQDPAVFEKNFELTPAQKLIAITRCLEATRLLSDDMSDLEKYYMLALWENYSVIYDNDFWPGGYDFDHYSHQWDAYGVLEEHLGVCAGIAVTYAVLCHAADLPCKFVRCDQYLDHTISHIPDINGNSYYIDVTENSFFMSAEDDWSFEPIDLAFSGISDGDRPSDGSFEYRDKEDVDSILPANIKDFYKGKTGGDHFEYVPFEHWFNEYALHKGTTKSFFKKYEEKGSGKRSTQAGYKHASYTDFDKYPAQPYKSRKNGITQIWFLNDFYQEPVTIKEKIERKEFDEQLLIIDAIKENYDCSTDGKSEEEVAAELTEAINSDISSIYYFPSYKNGKVVAEETQLTQGTDYDLSVEYNETKHEATITLFGIGDYQGECQLTDKVKVNTALVTKVPIRNRGLQYNGSVHKLLDSSNPGEAANGTMFYAIGTKDEPPEEFSSDIPTATNAGAYYIWYMAVGDENHFDSEPQRILQPVVIRPIDSFITEENRIIRVGDTIKLSPVIEPKLATIFYFYSSDEDIVTVNTDGMVTGVAEGSAEITISGKLKDNDPNYAEPYDTDVTITVIPKEAKKLDAVTYQNVSGDGNVWYRGSRATSNFVFKRSADDASTIDHFTGIRVDGEMVDEANYTKESGSVVIKLKPTYLETLALGDHTLKVQFNDGSASAKFTVADKSAGGEKNQGNDSKGARTGDDSNILLWITLMTASLLAIVLAIVFNRRKSNNS